MKTPLKFPDPAPTADVFEVTLELAHEIREALRGLYDQQHEISVKMNTKIANIALTAMTIVWIEAVKSAWGTMHGESAIALLKAMECQDEESNNACRGAVRDFLRRSGWSWNGSEA